MLPQWVADVMEHNRAHASGATFLFFRLFIFLFVLAWKHYNNATLLRSTYMKNIYDDISDFPLRMRLMAEEREPSITKQRRYLTGCR